MITKLLLIPLFSTTLLTAYSGLNIDEIKATELGFKSVEAYKAFNADKVEELRILNCADYIYEPTADEIAEMDEDDPDRDNLTTQFEKYMATTFGRNVSVIYDTYDTNENLHNDLKTGKSNYDIIMPSDYMIQKMISEDMLEKLDKSIEMKNVEDNISPFVEGIFNDIVATKKSVDEEGNEVISEESISDYALPYMWGTVGILYNPNHPKYKAVGLEKLKEDFKSYDALYMDEYQRTISIKDSVRDMFAIGVVHTEKHKEEIKSLQETLHEVINNPETSEEDYNKAVDSYQESITELFNRNDQETLDAVEEDLIELKNKSFGFEVDSGKNDMLSGMLGGNLAWSGDAVFVISDAREDDVDIYFSLPTENTISNIWFDGMCIPKWADGKNQHIELAQQFMNFVYEPHIAALNSSWLGYTAGAAGQEMLECVQETYDVRYNEETGEIDNSLLEDMVEGEDYVKYDIRYFFDGTVEDTDDAIIYASLLDSESMLQAQFPENDQLKYLAVMRDFGERTKDVYDMWERVKTSQIPPFIIIILAVEVSAAVALILYFTIDKALKKKLRKQRGKQR